MFSLGTVLEFNTVQLD